MPGLYFVRCTKQIRDLNFSLTKPLKISTMQNVLPTTNNDKLLESSNNICELKFKKGILT